MKKRRDGPSNSNKRVREMPEKLVTIATFDNPFKAHLVKSRLESSGIKCFLSDEFVVTVNRLYSNAVGGVKLQVKESDLERAIELLNMEPIEPEALDRVLEGDTTQPRCPRCNSANVHYERYSRRFIYLSWLLLGVPLLLFKRKWRCDECGYQWRI
ncbi:TPA: DUF2007 domain-containing protein [Candidatus Poribacteria bacterium]|nr:DUF2007 domain-containing protein [Candidatus Poribacteria bacterium]